ncbi:MAG TPA: hypothetical protein VFN74_00335 [Chloroflexota bacterium]|jgi:hypothetical protein|nr:hypothetical protein [Chloroflexota bacterium]
MNEGQVQVGSRTMEIGRLRSLVSLLAGLLLGAGLAIGVVSAAPNGSAPELTGLPQTPRAPQGQAAPRPAIRRPLHQLLLHRVVGQAQRASGQARFAAGRVTEVDNSAATLTIVMPNAPAALPSATPPPGAVPPGGEVAASLQTRVIRVIPQTRLPQQRPRPGDFVLAVGRPERDGSLTARSIAVRRPGQVLRR